MFLQRIKSIVLYFIIQYQRWADHLYRFIHGLPELKRSLITPNLYLGGQYSLKKVPDLKRLGVTGIVNMRLHSVHRGETDLGLQILDLPTPDRTAPSMADLNKGVLFIDDQIKKGGKVYIHCKFGEGRGPTMAIAYLIHSGMRYDDAFTLVKKVRTFIDPTRDQINRLKEFEQQNLH